jgi:hypothetical protein
MMGLAARAVRRRITGGVNPRYLAALRDHLRFAERLHRESGRCRERACKLAVLAGEILMNKQDSHRPFVPRGLRRVEM